ncbi:hypothetical protein GVN21_20260 [Caulobacter sp. SLTY]|uniref:hypothetical protein n=1 Tax=Caulobacter sp. SLTY TaxID=2683262 RepID=UPI0014124568|nr:hypothetical protein [Caulobacter sp. SLTY]NBB17701.1 hypothetical protein [Caulobacter sp. SLTY]
MKALVVGMVAVASVATSGCAYITAKPARPDTPGFRVYPPKTYIVAGASGPTKLVLPDCSKPMAVQFGTFLAKQDVNLKMAEGMLTEVDSKQDSTLLASNLLTAITKMAGPEAATGKASSEGVPTESTRAFQLVEVNCDGDLLELKTGPSFSFSISDEARKPEGAGGGGEDQSGRPPPKGRN